MFNIAQVLSLNIRNLTTPLLMSNRHQITACPKTTQNRTKQEGSGGVVPHDHQIYENLTPFYTLILFTLYQLPLSQHKQQKNHRTPLFFYNYADMTHLTA